MERNRHRAANTMYDVELLSREMTIQHYDWVSCRSKRKRCMVSSFFDSSILDSRVANLRFTSPFCYCHSEYRRPCFVKLISTKIPETPLPLPYSLVTLSSDSNVVIPVFHAMHIPCLYIPNHDKSRIPHTRLHILRRYRRRRRTVLPIRWRWSVPVPIRCSAPP